VCIKFKELQVHPEVGGSKLFRNVGILLQHYMLKYCTIQTCKAVNKRIGEVRMLIRGVARQMNGQESGGYWRVVEGIPGTCQTE
jgi:hypothetical protein